MRTRRCTSHLRRTSVRSFHVESLEDRRALAVDFDFNFQAGNSLGFNDPSQGIARKTALEAAADELGALFDHTATIEVDVVSSGGSGLASATARFSSNPPLSGGFFAGVPEQKILAGGDPNGPASDAAITVFWGGTDWHIGAGPTPSGSFDFTAIMKHELLHTLGFSSGIARNGGDSWGNAPGKSGSIFSPFDRFMSDLDGTSLVDPQNFQLDLASWQTHSTGGTSPTAGLFFNGPNAMTANGGQPVGLYSPGTWQEGSSASHLDTNSTPFSDRTHLMVHAFGSGPVTRNVHPVEIAILEDLGYDMTVGTTSSAGFTVRQNGSATVSESGTQMTFSIVLDAAPTSDVQLQISSDDTTEVTVEPTVVFFNPTNWDTPQTVTVTGVADGVVDGDQTTLVKISVNDAASDDSFDALPDQGVTVTTLDTDVPGFTVSPSSDFTLLESGTTADLFVSLTNMPFSDVVLVVENGDPTEVSLSTSSLRFTPQNWNVPQTVTLAGVSDDLADGDQTTMITVGIDDANSDDAFDDLADQNIFVVTLDTATTADFVVTPLGESTVSETGTEFEFSVELASAPMSPVVISIENSDSTEVEPSHFNLIFTADNWDAPQTVTVSGLDDAFVDGDQSTLLTLSVDMTNSDDAFGGAADQTLTVVTLDDEVASVVVSEPTSSTISESGTTSISVRLGAMPESTVVVTIGSNDAGEAQVSNEALVFTPATWDLPRFITVSGVQDGTVDGAQLVSITIGVDDANSNDAFDVVADETVMILVTDIDDIPDNNLDFGDAGGLFPTRLVDDGARHVATGPRLGDARDTETDAGDGLTGDDTTGSDDEDGVAVPTILLGQTSFEITIDAQHVGGGALLDAWLDFDGDGIWQPDEQIGRAVALVEGQNVLTVTMAADAMVGSRAARFRVSSEGNLSPTGLANDGEVEDHIVELANSSWHNVDEPLDVDGLNGAAPTPVDALTIVNDLTVHTFSDPVTLELPPTLAPPPFLDVDNNGLLNPLDALLVINALPSNNAVQAAVPSSESSLAEDLMVENAQQRRTRASSGITSPFAALEITSAQENGRLAEPLHASQPGVLRESHAFVAAEGQSIIATDRCFEAMSESLEEIYSLTGRYRS